MTSAEIANGTIAGADLDPAIAISTTGGITAASFTGNGASLTGITVGDGTVTGGTAGAGVKIAALTITDANINAAANIAATKLATTVVLDTEAPAAGDITGNFGAGLQVAANAVTSAEITDATITGADLAIGSVDLATTDVTGTLPITLGGTGAATAATALTNLGALGTTTTAGGDLTGTFSNLQLAAGTIVDADINATAAIAGTKIAPSFGAQNIVTTGTLTSGAAGAFSVDGTGNITKIRNATTSFPAANTAGVLTNDGLGTLTWAAGSSWGLLGNAGTAPATQFIGTTDPQDFRIRTNNVERLTVTSAGLVGIGSNAPTAALGVLKGTALATASFAGTTHISHFNFSGPEETFIRGGLNGAKVYLNDTHNGDVILANGGGNVGIGTTTPAQKLTIAGIGPVLGFDNSSQLLAKNTGGSYETWLIPRENDGQMYLMYGANGFNIRNNSSVNTMFMNNAGNVGVGTTTPLSKLDVVGDVRLAQITAPGIVTDKLYNVLGNLFWNGSPVSSSATSGNGITVTGSVVDLGGPISNATTTFTSATDNMFQMISSNAALNTKAGFNLRMDAGSTARQYEVLSRKSDATANSGSSDFLINNLFSTAGGFIEAFKIDGSSSDISINGAKTTASAYGNFLIPNGNVGIGTTTPSEKLDVTGNVKFSGALMPNNLAGTSGQVLTSAGAGVVPTWTTLSGFTTLINDAGSRNLFAGALVGANGTDNVFVGESAGAGNSLTGDYNVIIGSLAAQNKTDGDLNTIIGWHAGFAGTVNHIANTLIGAQAGENLLGTTLQAKLNTFVGEKAGQNTTTGDNNVFIGNQVGLANTDGDQNVLIGNLSNVVGGNLQNAIAIGYQASVNASNKIRLGNAAITVIEGQVPYTNPSDRRLKTNINDIGLGIDFIKKLRPVTYQMKIGDGRQHWGFIAQEIEDLVGTDNSVLTIGEDSTRSLGLRYTDFIAPIVKAMQEQQKEIEDLKAQLKEKNEKVDVLESSVGTMNDELDRIKRVLGLEASTKKK